MWFCLQVTDKTRATNRNQHCYTPSLPTRGSMQELRWRLRDASARWPAYPDGVGFLVGDLNIFDSAEGRLNSRTQTFSDGDDSRAVAFSLFFSALSQLLSRPSLEKRSAVMVLFTTYLASTASSPTYRWPSIDVVLRRLVPLVTSRYPSMTSLSGLLSRVPERKQTDHPVSRR